MTPRRDEPVPPWKHNPSSWRQRGPICAIAFVAAAIAGWLALYQWRLIDSLPDPFFGAQSMAVLDSAESERMRRWFGVPDAALGVLAYLGDAIYGLAGTTRRWRDQPWLVILFGLDVIPLGLVSAVLVFVQGAVVGSWCTLCIVTAVLSLVLVVMSYDEVFSSILHLRRVWRERRDRRALWNAFWGRGAATALASA